MQPKFITWEDDRLRVSGDQRRQFFLDNHHRYDWTKESFWKAWREAWEAGGILRQPDQEADMDMVMLWADVSHPGDPTDVMDKEELRNFKQLEFPVTVYRGVMLLDIEDLSLKEPGYCWTLDERKAEWFAQRLEAVGVVLQAQATQAIALLQNRQEEEVVVDYWMLEDITARQL